MKTSKIDRIKEAVWNLSITYEETAKKLKEEGKPENAKLFQAYARGASNAYLAICAAAKGK